MNLPAPLDRRLSVAPMLDWTDRHCRYFLRLISRRTLLYTEMVTTGALIHGDRERHLGFDEAENPVAVQLGGSDPEELSLCARMAEDYGYDEVNLNVGCPSDRVQSGFFGACLMARPERVAECIHAMQEAVDIPVTVKHRIGIDEQDSYEALLRFVDLNRQAGCEVFIVHARKAWLQGLSPKENRDVPPLRYDTVARLKADFPAQQFILNGGIQTLQAAREALQEFDGVMMGRALYHNPFLLAEADSLIYGEEPVSISRHDIMEAFLPYVQARLDEGTALKHLTRHILGLFQGQPGAKHWRRHLSENAYKPGAGIEVILDALPDETVARLP